MFSIFVRAPLALKPKPLALHSLLGSCPLRPTPTSTLVALGYSAGLSTKATHTKPKPTAEKSTARLSPKKASTKKSAAKKKPTTKTKPKAKVEKKKKQPALPLPGKSKPKLPASAYMIFSQEVWSAKKDKPEYMKADKHGKMVPDIIKIAKEAGQQWSVLGDAEKAAYRARYEEAKAKQKAAMDEWISSLSPDDFQRQASARRSAKIKARKEGKGPKVPGLPKLLRDPHAPKRPLTPFFTYMFEVEGTDAGGANIGRLDFLREAATKWKALSDAEKKPYMDRHKKAYAEYLEEFKKYKASRGSI